MKQKEKEKARILRKQGHSIREIKDILGVSKSSVSLWVRDVELTPEQIKRLENLKKDNINKFIKGYAQSGKRNVNYQVYKKKRLEYQEEGRQKIKDPRYISISMLYWGEGDKSKNTAGLSNSNPYMLILFIDFLKRYYKCRDEDIRIKINARLNNGICKKEIEKYWLNKLCLPKSCLTKTTLNRHSHFSQKKKVGKLPYGTCRVQVYNTRIVQNIYGAIQEYGNFYEETWIN